MGIFRIIRVFLRALFRRRAALAAENMALRQQLAVLRQSVRRPRFRPHDRLFWVVLSRLWKGWGSPRIVAELHLFGHDVAKSTVKQYMVRDRDSIHGQFFRQRVKQLAIEEVLTAHRCPWQSPYVERLIGTIRRDFLDHVIVLNEAHLMRILKGYFAYYHESRTHHSLKNNAPIPRSMAPPERGKVISIPQVGGLHHRYARAA